MLRLRLFAKNDPSRQIDSHPLDEGAVVIGRDPKADWSINDPDRGISRRHLTIANRGGLVTVCDTSSNGVFVGEGRERIERDRATPIGPGETVQFGGYLLVLEQVIREEGRHGEAGRGSPFDAMAEAEPLEGGSDKPRSQPFGSALKPDACGATGPVGDVDAWTQRRDAPAGSWDAVAPHRKVDHTELIGSEQRWAEPPPPAVQAGYGFDAPFERPILEKPPIERGASAIPSDWMEAPAARDLPPEAPLPAPAVSLPPLPAESLPPVQSAPLAPSAPPPVPPVGGDAEGNAALFDHFCAGAGLNPQHFAGLDRAQMMERLGGAYRQAVLGIADLMRERTSLRNEYRMVHTTVRPEGNNPFKWVPPQRIAVELLRDEGGGYTTGERALNDALHDIKAHLLCMLAGMRSALGETFRALQPGQVEARLGGRSYLMAVQRDAALWNEYVSMAEGLRLEAEDNPDGLINRAFRQGYEEQAAALTGGGEPWQ
jgi:type VI secretion system FHA domain protein